MPLNDNLKKTIIHKRNVVAIALALILVGILVFSGPAIAFTTNELISAVLGMNMTTQTNSITLNISFEKKSVEVINNVSIQLVYYKNWTAIETNDYKLTNRVYATKCYDRDGYIGITGLGTPYQGYDYYGYGSIFGYDYGYGYGYGYGYDVQGTFYCEFTVDNLSDGIYTTIIPYINDIPLGEDNYLNIVPDSEGALIVTSFNKTDLGDNNATLNEDFVFEVQNANGEDVMTLTVSNGTNIYHDSGVPFAISSFMSPPDTESIEILKSNDVSTFLSGIFTFEPTGIRFDPPAEMCVHYNVSDSPLRTIAGDTDAEMDAYLEAKEDLLRAQFCNEDDGTCEFTDIELDTDANIICFEVKHFTQVSVVELKKSSSGTSSGTRSWGGTGGVPSSSTTEETEEENVENLTINESINISTNVSNITPSIQPYECYEMTLKYDPIHVVNSTVTVTVLVNGVPGEDVLIDVTTPSNEVITLKTDSTGRITFIPEHEGYYKLQIRNCDVYGSIKVIPSTEQTNESVIPPSIPPSIHRHETKDTFWPIFVASIVILIICVILFAGKVGGFPSSEKKHHK